VAQAQNLLCSMHADIRCLQSVFTLGHVSLLADRTLHRMRTISFKIVGLFLSYRKTTESLSTATGYSLKMLLTEHVTCLASMRNAKSLYSRKNGHHLEGLNVDEGIMLLQWILQKQVLWLRSGFMWLRAVEMQLDCWRLVAEQVPYE